MPFHGDRKDLQYRRFAVHPRFDDGWEQPGDLGADEFDQAVNDGFRVQWDVFGRSEGLYRTRSFD